MEFLAAENRDYERELLARVKNLWNQGLNVLKDERAYQDVQHNMNYVEGVQDAYSSQAISTGFDNKIQKVVMEICSALTDIRPIWNYEAANEFKKQSQILNKLARGWWKNIIADKKLLSALMWSCTGGSGYLSLTYDAFLPGGGDLTLTPYDPRDVIPIDPVYTDSIQDWHGVILRTTMPIEQVKRNYPAKAHLLQGDLPGSWEPKAHGKKRKVLEVLGSAWDRLSKGAPGTRGENKAHSVDVMRVFIKDDAINTGDGAVMMGDPTKDWSYWVQPIGSEDPKTGRKVSRDEARLYPRGRLIIITPNAVLWDGPNPYWHGMFPVVRFTLDPLPWTLLGSSIVSQLVPLQNTLNEALRGMQDGIQQWVRPAIIADKNAVSREQLNKLDSRKAGLKALINPTMGEGFKIGDGPNLPTWYMKMLEWLPEEMDKNSGVRGLQQMQQMKQMPNSDNMDKYTEALSPLLRGRARNIEVALGELAEMLKVGFFQYYTRERRMQILGKDGVSLEDFDYDPNTLVAATTSDDKDGADRSKRAERHHKNFAFSIAPNSFLNVSHTTHRMMLLQLFRAQGIDIYSVWESMDLPKIGPIDGETIPERMVAARKLGLQQGPTPEMVQAQEAATIAQAQAAILQTQMMQMQMSPQGQLQNAGLGGSGGPPGGGPPQPPGGSSVNAHGGTAQGGGRPPSGGQPPQMIQKGGRTIISESGK